MAAILTSGPAAILASGEATTYGGHGLRLELVVEAATVAVELRFDTDPEVEDVAVRSERIDGGYRFTCVNFDGPDGRGSSVPVLLCGLGEDGIFFHFRVFRWGRTEDRTVHYTFYRVPGVLVRDGGS